MLWRKTLVSSWEPLAGTPLTYDPDHKKRTTNFTSYTSMMSRFTASVNVENWARVDW
jgi:hypothetical protein